MQHDILNSTRLEFNTVVRWTLGMGVFVDGQIYKISFSSQQTR